MTQVWRCPNGCTTIRMDGCVIPRQGFYVCGVCTSCHEALARVADEDTPPLLRPRQGIRGIRR